MYIASYSSAKISTTIMHIFDIEENVKYSSSYIGYLATGKRTGKEEDEEEK